MSENQTPSEQPIEESAATEKEKESNLEQDQSVTPETVKWHEWREPSPAQPDAPKASKPQKPRKTVSLSTFICSAVALCLAAVMITYAVCSGFSLRKDDSNLPSGGLSNLDSSDIDDALALFAAIFESYSISDVSVDKQAIFDAALKEYVAQTGDVYARYYTAEEFEALKKESAGETQGIGINIIQSVATVEGAEIDVIKVVNIMKNSPALNAGVRAGDLIVFVGIGENRQSVDALGYDVAVKQMQGEAGTVATFTVYRPNGSDGYEVKEFSITREAFTSDSVMYHKCAVSGYENVGIIKIVEFDLTTPEQFCDAVDSLKEAGCTRFVFDVRHNPGGDLKSIEAVLSYFLNKGDTIIRTKDKSGKEEISKVKTVKYMGEYAGCSVSQSDIGKYRDLNAVVLCNENTASAAELFTATFRDYNLATIVGTKTYGKGSMQSILSLESFGCPGALKLTTKMYYPPIGDSYEGVGIKPDVTVELSEEAAKINVYDIADSQDNQLVEALKHFR